jgi:hypothetical protein
MGDVLVRSSFANAAFTQFELWSRLAFVVGTLGVAAVSTHAHTMKRRQFDNADWFHQVLMYYMRKYALAQVGRTHAHTVRTRTQAHTHARTNMHTATPPPYMHTLFLAV